MLGRTVLGLSAVLLLVVPAAARECPTQDLGWEAREDAVRKAATCKEALAVAESCVFGASGDTGLTEIVMEKCAADFSGKMSKAQRQAYDAGIKRCDDKYRRKDGTIYRSMDAFCRATLARDTATKFAKAPPR